MTDIDPQADIELHSADEHVTVRVPLAGPVTGEWLRCYQQLAGGRLHHDSGTSDCPGGQYLELTSASRLRAKPDAGSLVTAGKVATRRGTPTDRGLG
jgi:hypothetical protein